MRITHTVYVHNLYHRRKRAGKKSGGGRIFFLGGYSASRIFFWRIFGVIIFFGGGGQIRRLGGLRLTEPDRQAMSKMNRGTARLLIEADQLWA